MEAIIAYLKERYQPLSILVYGSYGDGSVQPDSDFDALVLSQGQEQFHDTGFVEGVRLDVFVYPASYFDGEVDYEDFLQIFDGRILMDTEGRGEALRRRVRDHLNSRPRKSQAERRADLDWCAKMLARAARGDAEGWFRWHWLLTDSLEIFCDQVDHLYLGPKKTLRWMERACPEAFCCYQRALSEFQIPSLSAWVAYLRGLEKRDTDG